MSVRRPSDREVSYNAVLLWIALAYTVLAWFIPDLIAGWPFLAVLLYWGHRIDNRERDWRIEQIENAQQGVAERLPHS